MNIQIFGVNKCFDTKKAERYFKERKIKYQYVDLLQYPMSKGVFESVRNAVGLEALIDKEAKEYKTLDMAFYGLGTAADDMMLKHPKLFRTPVVRNGRQATVGYCPDVWEKWE